ncbi:MAG: hypothetical protein ACK2U2_23680 [Anaerolineae bacterium]|jgi:hypothetical protein
MMRKGIRLVQVITLVAAASMIVLKLQASILAQASEPIGDVPESRQAMGMNLSPYREGGVPIDEPIVSDLENLGVKWMRFEFRAKGTPPSIPLADYTVAVNNLAAHGVEALGLIDYTTLPRPKEEWPTTDYREAFVSLTASLVDEFKDQIHAWEIWNEEDIGYDPDPLNAGGETYVSPQHYAYLLGGDPTADESTHPWAAMGVYEAIKSRDPGATVLLGGLSNAWKGEDGRGAGNYLAELYEQLSGRGYGPGSWPFDVVAVHPYYGLNPDPRVYLFDGGEYILRANLWAVMDANGDGDKRFWITEIGWNTNSKQWACIFPSVSESSQSSYLYRSWDIFLNEPTSESEVLVDKVFWFLYQDTGIWVDPATCPLVEGLPPADIAADPRTRIMPPRVTPTPGPGGAPDANLVVIDFWFGVVHGDYVPKPAYYAYKLSGQVEGYLYLPLILRQTP